jgi:predicted TIM-barrel fold metal-dependent hydrolase
MRVITLEEHYRSKHSQEMGEHYYRRFDHGVGPLAARLADIGAGRIADMDANGIDLQILSHTVPSPEILPPDLAIPLCRLVNEELAEAVSRYPARFGAFASLPLADPNAAAAELEHTVREFGFKGAMVHGVSHGRFLDDTSLFPVLERAEALNVPIYLHPAPPPEPVFQAYFSGLDPAVSLMLSTAGWGWHSETAMHTLRLIASGTFDRFPRLQLIIGHMGEMIPFQLARIDRALTRVAGNLRQSPAAYFQSNIHITTSGLFTAPPLRLALEVLGADRVLFSIDYPYSGNDVGAAFLDSLALPPDDFDKITHRNAEKLFGLG